MHADTHIPFHSYRVFLPPSAFFSCFGMRSCEVFTIHISESISVILTQVLFRQLHYWGIKGGTSQSALGDKILQNFSCFSGFPPLSPSCSLSLIQGLYCRYICPGWAPGDQVFSVFWPVVDFCNDFYLLQRDTSLIRVGAKVICKYKNKYLECSYKPCWFRKVGYKIFL